MNVRPATPADSRAIAGFIAMAESEMVHHFTGTTDPDASKTALEKFILSPTPNRYSIANNIVAEIGGEVAGSIISFPADDQPALDTILLAYLNARGYGLKELFFEGEKGTYYLSTMGVEPKFRGQGVGTALMAAAEQKGRDLGYALVSLLVSKGKPRARTLYERVGFEVVEETQIADVEYYRMHKPL
ncbi:MAG: GNAT family N-acetyltransferase [Planctomycetaceae bacterium]|nr:GNAT family N-acetyltransferase [Planctomycetaceae bacterium]